MGLLYKKPEEIVYSATISERKEEDNITITFWCDGGKFGTHEILDEHTLNPLQLLQILQAHENSEI